MSSDGYREMVAVSRAPHALQPLFVCAVARSVTSQGATDPLMAWVHANPYACLNVVTSGQVLTERAALPDRFLVGPLSAPLKTWVPGDLRSVSLVFQPWLLEPLFGLRSSQIVDSIVDADPLHPRIAPWCLHAGTVASGAPDWTPFWEALAADLPQPAPAQPSLAFDTLASEGVQAAARLVGCSPRHYARRFERQMGLNPSTWLRLIRWEHALRELADGDNPETPLSDLAASARFADQSHMTRETRAIAANSPAHLRASLHQGSAAWSLQPARVRSVQDKG